MRHPGQARAAVIAALLVTATACSGDMDPVADSSPSAVAASATPTATASPNSTGSPSPTMSQPEERPYLSVIEPALDVPVPEGYGIDSLEEYRDSLEAALDNYAAPEQAIIRELIDQIDEGIIVGSFTSMSDAPAPSVTISVETGDASLAEAVDRRVAFLQDTGSETNVWKVIERDDVALPIGDSVRVLAKQDPAPGLVSISVEYVVLVDGLTLSLSGTAPFTDQTFGRVMDRLARGTRLA